MEEVMLCDFQGCHKRGCSFCLLHWNSHEVPCKKPNYPGAAMLWRSQATWRGYLKVVQSGDLVFEPFIAGTRHANEWAFTWFQPSAIESSPAFKSSWLKTSEIMLPQTFISELLTQTIHDHHKIIRVFFFFFYTVGFLDNLLHSNSNCNSI